MMIRDIFRRKPGRRKPKLPRGLAPVLFQPNADYAWAWKKNISGTAASFRSLTQYFANPEFWSLTG